MASSRIIGADAFLREWFSANPCIAAHTSGSTGIPKQVSLEKSAMRLSAKATNTFFGIDASSTLVCPLSADYIAGKMMVVRALEAGCRLIMLHPASNPLANLPQEWLPATLLPIVPAQIEALLDDPRLRLIRHIIVGGAPLSLAQEEALAISHPSVWATYGMTETCSHVALRSVSRRETHFTALPGVSFTTDQRNCLVINHETVTNDVVKLLSPTSFMWLGRADNVVISGALKLFPETIEQQMRLADPALPDFYLTSRSSAKWGRELVAVALGPCADPESLLLRLRDAAPSNRQAPKAIVVDLTPEFTTTGKLRRRKF